MRTTGYAFVLVFGAVFAACSDDGSSAVDVGTAGRAPQGSAGVAGVVAAGSGNGGASAGSAGSAGTTSKGGAAGNAGFAGTVGNAGSAGTAGNAGAAGTAGNAGVSGSAGADGGAAGQVDVGGAPGGGEGGAGNEGGLPGDGGAFGEGGAAGDGDDANEGGAAGQNVSGAAGEDGDASEPLGLSWPVDCIPNETCTGIGYPDTDLDGDAHDCSAPGYVGHQGTDIGITFEAQAAGTAVRAAADGVVLFAFDGKYDQCPNANEPDCVEPDSTPPGSSNGTTVCTPEGPYCGTGEGRCYWCFAGGNVIVIRHEGVPGVFATRYDHLKRNSVLVEPGDTVTRGQKIAEAASAGASTAPHLHFEVWGTGFYELADPWAGACGPNTGPSLWAYDPPWSG